MISLPLVRLISALSVLLSSCVGFAFVAEQLSESEIEQRQHLNDPLPTRCSCVSSPTAAWCSAVKSVARG